MIRRLPTCSADPPSASPPRRIPGWEAAGHVDHFVQFYRTDDYLIECLAGFVADALWAGETAVVIGTAEHRVLLEQRLRLKGVDLVNSTIRQHFIAFDARDLLQKFMREGRPDRDAFRNTVGAMLSAASRTGRRLRAFGEMVGLLWMEGRRAAAIELENLWNEINRELPFALYCAYPAACAQASDDGFTVAHICAAHSCVVSLGD